MREQLFHAWRSLHYGENVETVDAYVTCIRQVAMLLGYGKPQILMIFKNSLPNRLYCILFPIENLQQAVKTAKRVLTKEKINRHMSGQSATTPFMRVSDVYNSSVGKTSKRQYH